MSEDQDEIVKTDEVIDSIRAELDKVSPSCEVSTGCPFDLNERSWL
jgi:hypothetical protein